MPLLPSGPGGVRGLPLRRTRLSSASASFLSAFTNEYIRVSASVGGHSRPSDVLFPIQPDAVRVQPSH